MDWMNFWTAVGAIGGIIGGVSGVLSLVKVNKLKSQDLKIEHGRLKNTVQILLTNLDELSTKANQSRVYRLAAQGKSQSGMMQKRQNDFQRIKGTIAELSTQFSDLETETHDETLEQKILELHLIEEKAKSVTKELNDSIVEDDAARDRLFQMRFGKVGS